MKTVDLFDLLTFEQREQVAEIFLEAMSNHNIFPGIWEMDKEESPIKCFELKALDTIYKAMKWAETNNEPELAVKYANLYITNKKRLKK